MYELHCLLLLLLLPLVLPQPLKRHKYKNYTPIVSFYCSDRFADVPFPTSEDWEAATGMVYPKTFTHK
jgi:hypothetical protein